MEPDGFLAQWMGCTDYWAVSFTGSDHGRREVRFEVVRWKLKEQELDLMVRWELVRVRVRARARARARGTGCC